MQMLRQRLKEAGEESPSSRHRAKNTKRQGEEKLILTPAFFCLAEG
jgi:hypothetical protein